MTNPASGGQPPHAMTTRLHALSGAAGRDEHAESWSVAPPIYQTSTFAYASSERAAESCAAVHPVDCYSRYGNPNFAAIEEAEAHYSAALTLQPLHQEAASCLAGLYQRFEKWAELVALGIDDDKEYEISLQVTDTAGSVASDTGRLIITPTPPIITSSGATNVSGTYRPP